MSGIAPVSHYFGNAPTEENVGRFARVLRPERMHLAEELLDTTELGVVPVARRVGYESEEAFSRAFKRAHGESPGRWRARDRGHDPATTNRGMQ